ncbi:hypothetical protein ACI6QG_14170 [Roseococcus sp. DSY-14]|uniref:hypothetical protein n=1 Tax=Roseococcus sp. DSY-14 TaxID=3369650 RepID=UPI00387AAD2F
MTRALLLALLLAAPAAAQTRPSVLPTRDAAVTYRLSGAAQGQLQELRLSFLAARGLVRVDAAPGAWIVADGRGRSGFMVIEAQRTVMDLPSEGNAAAALPRDTASFVREGADSVAGLPCTIWRVTDEGRSSRACLTEDGLLLRAESPQGRMEATAVSRAPLDPARFERPPSFRTMAMPGGRAAPAGEPPRGSALPPPGLGQR